MYIVFSVNIWSNPLKRDLDEIIDPTSGAKITFNGAVTIWAKTRLAVRLKLGGVMIWEVGQDCRLVPVTHGTTTHVRTCPTDQSSLLLSITAALRVEGVPRYRVAGWVPPSPSTSDAAAAAAAAEKEHDEL